MTPLEVGLLGLGLIFFGGSFFLRSGSGLWAGLLVGTLGGSFLAFQPGNFFLLNWPITAGWGQLSYLVGLINPVVGTSFVGTTLVGLEGLSVHTTGVALSAGPSFYQISQLGGGLANSDFKFLSLLLLGGATLCFLQSLSIRPIGYEPLLIGLVAVVAGLLTFSLDNLVLLYLALELQALALYTLVGLYKFEEERTDSALKYLLSGSLVSGFMLLAFSRWYGLNGSFQLTEGVTTDLIGSAWVTGVLLFKVGVAPFHFWTPLAYTPLEWGTLAVVLGATKVNIWYLLVFNLTEFTHTAWWPTWWAAFFSILIGSVGGYFQTGVGGLLAYSGVINGGYLVLLSLASPVKDGNFSFGYYASIYLIGTIGVVMVASVWRDTRISTFAVWGKLGVGIPLLLYYLSLSLGGLPVFPGFFAKVILLKGLAEFGFFAVTLVVVSSLIPAVYYVGLAGTPLFGAHEAEATPPGQLLTTLVVGVAIGLNSLAGLLYSLV